MRSSPWQVHGLVLSSRFLLDHMEQQQVTSSSRTPTSFFVKVCAIHLSTCLVAPLLKLRARAPCGLNVTKLSSGVMTPPDLWCLRKPLS